MLFNSGTPSLVSLSREYAGDPSDAARNTWDLPQVKEKINLAIREMRSEAGIQDTGVGLRRTYAPTVAGQIFYSKHADLENVDTFEIEVDGKDLSTTPIADANIVLLEPRREDFAMTMYRDGNITSPVYYFKHDEHLGIVAPPGVTGDNTMRMTIRGSTFDLVDDEDEPALPRDLHELIAVKAAIRLMMSREFDFSALVPLHNKLQNLFIRNMQEPLKNRERQIPLVGRPRYQTLTKFGSVFRRDR